MTPEMWFCSIIFVCSASMLFAAYRLNKKTLDLIEKQLKENTDA